MHSERERIRGRESPNFVIEGVRNVCDCPEPVGVTHLRGASTVRGGECGMESEAEGSGWKEREEKEEKEELWGDADRGEGEQGWFL